MPVIAIASNDSLLESSIQICKKFAQEMESCMLLLTLILASIKVRECILRLAEHAGMFSSILPIPLQLLAYHAALQKNTDVDKPRDLAQVLRASFLRNYPRLNSSKNL